MNYYKVTNGAIVASSNWEQPGYVDENHPTVVLILEAQAAAQSAKIASEQAYAYAASRAREYVQEFSKAPQPSQIDAIGHLLDAILGWIETHEVTPELQVILDKRQAVKERNPKP